ncbi:aromatic alcohol reductase [Pollutimonas bauzanensis]|uniref:NmrA-like family protein n=1 Tax=Pollutimonas bauzanensis TaxID=658167 RepID=A0A1M5UJD3_9BURK|nr:aromatic alcohol reductase [Pollutimonas bauzanensis]SHH62763.1 NmrA-like family protein [Pollutimonas bauzanensis]
MSQGNSILVLGAGELGMAVLRNLARRTASVSGVSLSVFLRQSSIDSRDADKQKDIAELRSFGIELVAGDLAIQSEASLAAAFRRFDTVISCTGFVGGAGVQLKITHAVLDAGVKRYIPWQFGVDYDVIGRGSAQSLFDEQLDVRDLLRSQNQTEWVIVSTGMFTSFLFEPSFGVVDLSQNTVHALGSWDNAVTVTTANDIGMLTAEILFAEPRIADQVVYVAGDTITYRQLADTVNATLGLNVSRVEWSVAQLKRDLAGEPESSLKKYRLVFAEGAGVAWDKERTFNMQHGYAVMDLEGWMRENFCIGGVASKTA